MVCLQHFIHSIHFNKNKMMKFAIACFLFVGVNGMGTPICPNGLQGYNSSNNAASFCCPIDCGACGGIGCGSFGQENGLIGRDCCQNLIFDTQVFCDESLSAPCIMESFIDDPDLYYEVVEEELEKEVEQVCSNGFPGFGSKNNAAEFCCPLGCNFCGGVGCGSSGEEFGLFGIDCCQSGIFSTQVFCEYSGSSPCIVESFIDDPKLYTTSIQEEDSGLLSSSSSKKHGISIISIFMTVFGIILFGVSSEN